MNIKSRNDRSISFGETSLVVDTYFNIIFLSKGFNLSFHHFDERKTIIQIGSSGKRKIPSYRFAGSYTLLRESIKNGHSLACHRLRRFGQQTRYAMESDVLTFAYSHDHLMISFKEDGTDVVLSLPVGIAQFLAEYVLANSPDVVSSGIRLGHQVLNDKVPDGLSSREVLRVRSLLHSQ